jgi:glycosyltransferase involved in cell wall biosynthesis
LAEKLQSVLGMTEDERDRVRRHAVERVRETYSWEKVTDAYEQLLVSLAGTP